MAARTLIMGILNVTPDSFSDGLPSFTLESFLKKGQKLLKDGANILDIGGESTRPGAEDVPEEEELKRVIPLIRALKKTTSIPLSIDTRKPAVAEKALEAGASFINDITALSSPQMRSVAKNYQSEVCIMHMQGTPKTMQLNPHYPEGIIPYLKSWFEKKIELLLKEGIAPEKIILDPGIGFGKTVEDNLAILAHFSEWKKFGLRVLIGLSRKSFLSKILSKEPQDLLPATLAMNTIAILAGADIIRVHDVQEHRDVLTLLSKVRERKNS